MGKQGNLTLKHTKTNNYPLDPLGSLGMFPILPSVAKFVSHPRVVFYRHRVDPFGLRAAIVAAADVKFKLHADQIGLLGIERLGPGSERGV